MRMRLVSVVTLSVVAPVAMAVTPAAPQPRRWTVERLGLSGFDYAFLASGIILIAIGWFMVRTGRKGQAPAAAHRSLPAM